MLMHGSGAFDPSEIAVLQQAFDIAWGFLQRDPVLGGVDEAIARQYLARELLISADGGETDARRLANGAIWAVRRAAARRGAEYCGG
jgi:hypothetical protein